MDVNTKVETFMTPLEKLIVAKEGTTLKEANDIIWEHKLNSLPIVDSDGKLVSFVFRKDYSSHKENPDELLDSNKRYIVGAGINTRDYEQRINDIKSFSFIDITPLYQYREYSLFLQVFYLFQH